MAVTAPNYTQIPNEILDRMHEMTPAEFKVLVAICRKTFGWQKTEDVISLSQLEEMTGLSRTAVQSGIMAAIERGLLERIEVGRSFSYRLIVASDYQSTQTTSSVRLPEIVVSGYSEIVASDYSQKKLLKELKKRKKGGESGGDAPPPPLAVPAVAMYEEIFDRALTPEQGAIIAARVTDLGHWRRCCEDWKLNDYRAGNLAGLLDRYQKPEPSPAPGRARSTPRTGPPPGVPPTETEAEIKRKYTALNRELLKGLPANI